MNAGQLLGGTAADVDRVVDHGRPPLQSVAGRGARNRAEAGDPRDARRAVHDEIVELLERERAERVDDRHAVGRQSARGLDERRGVRELGEQEAACRPHEVRYLALLVHELLDLVDRDRGQEADEQQHSTVKNASEPASIITSLPLPYMSRHDDGRKSRAGAVNTMT